MARSSRFEAFCIVGMGSHARTKILPAIVANGQALAAVVSKSYSEPGARVYATLADALRELGEETAFVVATPPGLHFEQTMEILAHDRDVIVEKPAFVTGDETRRAVDLANGKGLVLAEAMMYRHTVTHARLLAFWREHGPQVRRLSMRFLIDRMPVGTFRLDSDLASSSVFDIGCYPMSLLYDLGLAEVPLRVADVEHAGQRDRECSRLVGQTHGLDIEVVFGVAAAYENSVILELEGVRSLTISPIFYGRPGKRTLKYLDANGQRIETEEEPDAFQTMLRVTRPDWLQYQGERGRTMIAMANQLSQIAKSIQGFAGR